MITLRLPREIAETVFAALNDDDGCRNAVGHAIESARGKKLSHLEREAIALGFLSAKIADALQHPTQENDDVVTGR